MALSRLVARPLLSSMFVFGGLDSLLHPDSKVKAAEAVTVPLTERVPALPGDARTLVRVNGAVQVGAGLLLATGRWRRIASLALIGSIIPTTFAGHRFWEEDDEGTRRLQTVHFLKNLGLLGGLILAAVDTEGRPSLGWRARRRVRLVGAAVPVELPGELLSKVHDHLP
jgi:putative oxidoreductase